MRESDENVTNVLWCLTLDCGLWSGQAHAWPAADAAVVSARGEEGEAKGGHASMQHEPGICCTLASHNMLVFCDGSLTSVTQHGIILEMLGQPQGSSVSGSVVPNIGFRRTACICKPHADA